MEINHLMTGVHLQGRSIKSEESMEWEGGRTTKGKCFFQMDFTSDTPT